MAKLAVKREEPTVSVGFRVKRVIANLLDERAAQIGITRSDVARQLVLKGLGVGVTENGDDYDPRQEVEKLKVQVELLRDLLQEKNSK